MPESITRNVKKQKQKNTLSTGCYKKLHTLQKLCNYKRSVSLFVTLEKNI